MSQMVVEIQGTLQADGTLVLDEKPSLPPGPVRVMVRPVIDFKQTDIWKFFERLRAEQAALMQDHPGTAAQQAGDALTAMNASVQELSARVGYDTLPRVNSLADDVRSAVHSVDRAADTLLRVAEYGAAKNILVNLENDNPVSEDPFFIVSIIEKVNNPWLHTNPDFANTLMTGKTEYAYKGVEAMFKHAYSICHVKAMEADEKGQLVHADMAKTFGILKSSNYKGYCSMEFDSPGDPNQGTSNLIAETLKFLS